MLKIGDNRPMVLKRSMKNVAEMVVNGAVSPHVGGRFDVKEIAEAHSFLESRKSIGKVIVTW